MSALVSVVMSVFNAEKYLKESIDSILNQTFQNFEFIIINDGSIDNSLGIIKSFNEDRIILINQENSGIAAALNKGISKARTNYIARADADDICLPDRLKQQFYFLEEHPVYIAVGSNVDIIDKNGNFIYTSNLYIEHEEIAEFMQSCINSGVPNTPFYHSVVMFRKEIFYRTGEYCEEMTKSQDTVLFNRMIRYGKYYNIKESLLKYRIEPNAITVRGIKNNNNFGKVLLDAIEDNIISNSSKEMIKQFGNNISKKEKYFKYYLHIAKKNIQNNNIFEARKNLKKAFIVFPFKRQIYLYLLFSFLPYKLIKIFYKKTR